MTVGVDLDEDDDDSNDSGVVVEATGLEDEDDEEEEEPALPVKALTLLRAEDITRWKTAEKENVLREKDGGEWDS